MRAGSRNLEFLETFLDEGGVLDAGEAGVEAVLRHEFIVGAALDDAALAQDEDLAGPADGAEAVGDDEAGAVGHEAVEGFLNEPLGGGVHAGGGFVEDEQGGVLQL